MATNYRALVPGGFFWDGRATDDQGRKVNVSVRSNNPGAVNGAAWERSMPGYVTEIKYDGKNNTTVFETPEQGVAVWYELMRKYRASGATTVHDIIWKYGGGQANYESYATQVSAWTGLRASDEIPLVGDDAKLLKFARAMFRYEAGVESPLSDAQIVYGFNLARGGVKVPDQPKPLPVGSPAPSGGGFWTSLAGVLGAIFRPPAAKPGTTLATTRILRRGDVGPDVTALQTRLREVGFTDVVVDGEFGEVTVTATRAFQTRRNIDPDGEVGDMTRAELNKADAVSSRPPLLPPSTAKYGDSPSWYKIAEGDIGFHETGANRGIEKFIAAAKTGSIGDPWCAIGVNSDFERAGIHGSRSAMARSFETSQYFRKLSGPALGCVVTNWRGSPSSGLGHVFLYDGEGPGGVRGIGYNEDDQVKRSFHPPGRVVGYYWPTDPAAPQPRLGRIVIGGSGSASSEV